MFKGIFIAIGILLLPPAAFAAHPAGAGVHCLADSLCPDPMLLHFRFNRSLVEYHYMDNPATLARFDVLFADSLQASLIDSITITSYASPEGDPHYNARLAHRRAVAVKGYLIWKYPHLNQYHILTRPRGEDWARFRRMIEADPSVPDREDVLKIFDAVPDTERCKLLLRQLNGGKAYRYINKVLLPQLRNAAVCLVKMKQEAALPAQADAYSPLQADTLSAKGDEKISHCQPDTLSHCQPDTLSGSMNEKTSARPHGAGASTGILPRSARPLLSVKTNLLTWAGLTPDGKLASFRPNLALEVFFARRWSLSASGEYSYWQGGTGHKFWGLSGYSLEPRLWLLGDGTYRWLYLGAYGQMGDYDYQPHPDGDPDRTGASLTGTYWSAGLSVGLYLRLSRHWGVEAGLRGGYRDASGKAYDNEPPYAYYHHDAASGRWGITGFNLSITYRWWNKTAR